MMRIVSQNKNTFFRRRLLAVLTVLALALSACFASLWSTARGTAVYAAGGGDLEGNVLKLTVTIPEDYRAGGSKAGSEIYLNYSILNWIEATPALSTGGKIVYDVYSPTPMRGLGGISGQFTGTGDNQNQIFHRTMENLGMVDAKGYSAAASADLSEAIGNGWYHREIELPLAFAGTALEPYRIGHIAIPVCIPAGTTVTSDTLEVYYRDIKLVGADGREVSLITSQTSVAGGFALGNDFVPNVEGVSAWGSLSSPAAKQIPAVDTATLPRAGYINETIDFSDVAFTGKGTAGLSASLFVNGTAQAGLGITSTEAGAIRYSYRVSDSVNGLHTQANGEIVVLANKDSVYFFDSDKQAVNTFLQVLPGETARIPFVYGFYEGNVKASLTVSDMEDRNYPVTEENGCYVFTLAAADTEYILEFSAEKAGKTGAFTRRCKVAYPDMPFIDESTVPVSASAGDFVSLAGVRVVDYQDGELTPNITVTDPFGDKVTLLDKGFYAAVAGNYTLSVAATDSDDNTVEKNFSIIGVKIVGQVIQWRIYVPENLRAEGQVKSTRQSIYGYINAAPYKFKAGDVLSYEVYSPSGIQGTGLIDGQHDGGAGKWYSMNENGWYDCKDQNGIAMGYEGDISQKAKDGWYYRESAVTAEMAADGSVRHLALAMYSTDAIDGEYIDVYYRNIKVKSADGNEYIFYNGLHQLRPSHLGGNDLPGNTDMSDAMYSVMNPFYTVDLSQIKEQYETAQQNKLPAYVINYRTGHKINDVIITATNDVGTTVTLVNGILPDNLAGKVTLRYRNIDGAAEEFDETITISVVDTTKPTVATKSGATTFTVKKGQTFTLPELTVSDNYDTADHVRLTYRVTSPSGETITLNKKELFFTADEKGTYTVTVTARDGAANESTLTLTVTVKSGATLVIVLCSVFGGLAVAAAVVVTLVLVRKKKRA